jgi:alpha-tubulin suppressor-like RCC1 family protein
MLLDAPAQDAVAAEEGSPASVTAPLIVRDIACGVAHVVAADEHGSLYCWGLNKTNQLGLDTTRTQHFPAAAKVLLASIPDPENVEAEYPQILAGVSIAKVYAHGHSSAAIDSEGRVFTWGSSADHRLMHILPLQPLAPSQHKALSYTELRTQRMACAKGYVGHVKAVRAQARQEAAELKAAQRQCITSVPRPTLVQSPDLQDCVVHSFAFAKSHSAALVLTCLKKVTC